MVEPQTGRGRQPRRRSARRQWGSISRAQIVDAALLWIESEGFDSLTIRGLSNELGTAPMSLYRHVRDKDDLLDDVADRLLDTLPVPKVNERDWMAWVTEAADMLRALLVAQPAVLHVYLRHPVVSPAAIRRMEGLLAVLRGAGLSESEAHRAYAAVQTYTIGFAALQASRQEWETPEGAADPVLAELSAYTTSRQFADGLGYMLDGIARASGAETRRNSAHGTRKSRSATTPTR